MKESIPPQLFLRFFRWFCHPKLQDYIEGDLMELYKRRLTHFGRRKADIKFIIDVLLLFRPGIIRPTEGRRSATTYGMYTSYFKIGWRNLWRSKGYSLINIIGLSTGMSIAILIGLWIYDELSFNKSFRNYDRVGQVMVHNGAGTYKTNPIPLADELRSSYQADFEYVVASTQTQKYILSIAEKKFSETGNFMQPESVDLLTLRMVYGTRNGLHDPHSILLAESLSFKLFRSADPTGKEITINNELHVIVTGVFKDFPNNSDFSQVTFIAPWQLMLSSYDYIRNHENDWGGNFMNIFVQIRSGQNFEDISHQIKDVKVSHLDPEKAASKPELFIHPMSQWHLYSKFENRKQVTSDQLRFVWFYGLIGIFIVVLASINFMNLSTARSVKRLKEVGLRKSLGSVRLQLINQFFTESFLTVVLAGVLAVVFAEITLPVFNDVSGKRIEMPLQQGFFWLALISFIIITSLIAGSYPAFHLSSFNPVRALKGTLSVHTTGSIPRKVLVTFQFAVSIMLSIGTIIVYQQLQFVKNRPVGYSRDRLIMIPKSVPEFQQLSGVLINELKNSPVIDNVAESSGAVTSIWGFNGGFTWDGKDPDFHDSFGTVSVSHDYGKTVGWVLLEGRDFSRQFASDSSALIINETAARYMGMKDPVGKTIKWNTEFFDSGDYLIIGVVEDMVMDSPYAPVPPMIFFLQGYKGWILAKLNPKVSMSDALTNISEIIKKTVPSAPFEYHFASDSYASKFKSEEQVETLASAFALLAVLISCLGLFGLASYVAQQRTKEIGIRKVLGASAIGLWRLLTGDFLRLVLLSGVIAIPTSYFFMRSWLQNYEYRIDISLWTPVLAIIGALLVTLLTVSYQAVKAAWMNPVSSIRTE